MQGGGAEGCRSKENHLQVSAAGALHMLLRGRNLVESSVPVLIDIGWCQISKFPKLPCVVKLETKLMIILPRIKADYDNYIHFNHIKHKIEAVYIYVHSILHVFTKI